jgi:hypothetical protein
MLQREEITRFLAELRRRSAALRTGLTTARPATEVLAELLRRQVAETETRSSEI